MNLTLWILQALLAAMFLMGGVTKLTAKPKADQPYSSGLQRFIGIAEVLGAVGLILPGALDIAPVLTGIAAIGIAVIMVLAAIFHAKRNENKAIIMNVVLLLIALFVAVGRFVIAPF
ncbi:DoxX family protein [Paenibacillus sp. NPDC058071]|uniref:DoxX family protein n=1 Tax=Paenibacillus sp. NPDC058071 TaxID=3346326 RepID=UPI0036DE2293